MFRLDIWYCHLATTGIIDYLITDYTQQPMPAQHDRQQGDFCSLRYQFAGLASCFSTDQNKLKSLEDVLQKPDEGNLHVRFCEGDHSNSGLLPLTRGALWALLDTPCYLVATRYSSLFVVSISLPHNNGHDIFVA